MRVLFGCLAVLLGAVSILLAARYGYKGADTEIDGVISGVVFGAIALCAFIFDAAAVRLWFMRHHAGAVVIGAISALALVVTFTNSLGAIAGRADVTQADRARSKDAAGVDRAELTRLAKDRAMLGAFTPATEDDATAARAAVAAAERVRGAECDKRGPRCRERETEEQGKRDGLAVVLANKALTDQAAKLDADAAAVRARLAKAPAVQDANPLGAALEQMIGAGSAALTAWQQAIVAAVFELCLVGVMVIYELLGQRQLPQVVGAALAESETPPYNINIINKDADEAREPLGGGKSAAHPEPPRRRKGSVKSFLGDHVFAANGERIEIKSLMHTYRTWCTERSFAPIDLNAFLDEIEKLCGKLGIQIDVEDDQRVYCLNVKLKPAEASTQIRVH